MLIRVYGKRTGVIYVIRTIFHNGNYGNILSLEVWVKPTHSKNVSKLYVNQQDTLSIDWVVGGGWGVGVGGGERHCIADNTFCNNRHRLQIHIYI